MRPRRVQQVKANLPEALINAFKQEEANLLWVNAAKQRYYRAVLQRDLLGDLIIMQMWGGIGTCRRGKKNQFCKDLSQVKTYMNSLHKRRSKRGYSLK